MAQDLLQKIVNTNLDFVINEILPLIDNEYAKVSATEVMDRLKQTIVALTDDIPGNKDQISLIWGSITSDPEILDAVRTGLLEAVSKIQDTKIKAGLTTLVNPIMKTLTAVTDSVKPDGAQLEQIWKDYLDSPEFLAFVISNLGWILSKIVKDKDALKWIEKIITALIK